MIFFNFISYNTWPLIFINIHTNIVQSYYEKKKKRNAIISHKIDFNLLVATSQSDL